MLPLHQQDALRQRYQTQIQPGHQFGLDRYRDLMNRNIRAGSVVLDVGCGPAGLVAGYTPIATVVGVDQHLTGFTEFDGQFGLTHLAESPIHALPFAANTFDVVTCSWVLEHLADPAASLREVARVLKPGGHLLFITPNALNYVVGLRRLVPEARSQRLVKWIYARDEDFINPTFYRANTPNDLQRLCAAAGLTCATLEVVSDPTYLALNEALFWGSIIAERLLARVFPLGFVHLVGDYIKGV
ncbi:MAG: methyltransferase domain-containing protein [Phototrophicaceae bacterium]|jgi:SAM-dependent methyltransferase